MVNFLKLKLNINVLNGCYILSSELVVSIDFIQFQ